MYHDMRVFYKSPVNNKIYSGSYNRLKNDDALIYFNVKFFKTKEEAEKEPNTYL